MKQKEEKCCGNCCWFFSEDTDGWGFCAANKGTIGEFINCTDMCIDDFVSRQEMRHHMAVLLQWERYMSDRSELTLYRAPSLADRNKAMKFAYKYMKVFSEL